MCPTLPQPAAQAGASAMADEMPKPLEYSRLPVPTPPSELYPSWVLGMLWAGLTTGGLLLAAFWAAYLFDG